MNRLVDCNNFICFDGKRSEHEPEDETVFGDPLLRNTVIICKPELS